MLRPIESTLVLAFRFKLDGEAAWPLCHPEIMLSCLLLKPTLVKTRECMYAAGVGHDLV